MNERNPTGPVRYKSPGRRALKRVRRAKVRRCAFCKNIVSAREPKGIRWHFRCLPKAAQKDAVIAT